MRRSISLIAAPAGGANYIDLTRFIAIFAVVLGHFHPFIGIDNHIGRSVIYTFHMPIFFIISGFLSKSLSYSKNAYSLLIPYLIYNIIPITKLNFIPFITIDAFYINAPTWFFFCLFVIKVICDRINKYIPAFISVLILFVLICYFWGIKLPRLFAINAIVYGMLFFLFGKYLRKNNDFMNVFIKFKYAIYFITIQFVLYSLFSYDRYDIYLGDIYNPIVFIFTALFTSMSVLLLCNSAFGLIPIKLHTFIKMNSRGTMLIVGTHYVILSAVRRILPDDIYIPFLIKMLLTLLSSIPYFFIIKYTFYRFPFLYGKRKTYNVKF